MLLGYKVEHWYRYSIVKLVLYQLVRYDTMNVKSTK